MAWDDVSPEEHKKKIGKSWDEVSPKEHQDFQLAPRPSVLESYLRGVAQGGTADFADEASGAISAPLGALKSLPLVNKFTDDKDPDVVNYKKARDESRENYKNAREENPTSFNIGNFLGALAPGALLSGASGAPKAVSALDKILHGASTGAKFGAMQGLGSSTSEDALGQAKDVGSGVLAGGATGAGIGAIGAGIGALKGKATNTSLGSKLDTAYDLGQEGKSTLSKNTRREIGQEPGTLANDWWDQIWGENGLKSEKGKQYQSIMEKYKDQPINLTNARDEIENLINSLNEKNPKVAADKGYLSNLLKNYTEGVEVNKPVMGSEVIPEKTTYTPNPEEAVLQAQDQGHNIKVRTAFENSPKGKAKADELVAKLSSKAKLEGTPNVEYSIVHDGDNGLYNVIEKTPKLAEPAGTAVEQTYTPPQLGNQTQLGSFPIREGADPIMPYQDAKNMRQAFQGESNYETGSRSTNGGNIATRSAGIIGDALDQQVPELNQADADWHGIDQFEKQAQIDPSNKVSAVKKLRNLIYRNESESKIGDDANFDLGAAMDKLRQVSPDLADKFEQQASKVSKRVETARAAGNEQYKMSDVTGSLKGASIQAANTVGYVSRYFTKLAPQKLGQLGKSLQTSNNEVSRKLGGILSQASEKDEIGKNALIFTLMQNPTYREALKGLTDTGE